LKRPKATVKINRYELPENPAAQDLETLSLLQVAQRDSESRLASRADGTTKVTAAIWNDLRGILTVNSVAPTLPAVPLLSFFFRDESTQSIYFCGGTSFQRYPIAAHQIVGLALSSGDTWLLQLDLEGEKKLSMSVTGSYHERLLDVVSSIIFGRQKGALRTLVEEFYLLANVDSFVTRYSHALAGVALDKVKRDAQNKADQDRREEHSSWDDLILPAETKDDLRTYCEILRRANHYRAQGVRVPKGLLLGGPPGTGKTQTARVLSREAGFKFISCSTADLKVGWIGHAAAKVKDVFTQAREHSSALIFLDELDAICPRRGLYHDCISQEVTAQLLTEVDGVSSNGQAIFVVAATNRLDMMDGALLSRFTDNLTIGLPGPEARMQLMKLFVGKTPFKVSGTPEIEILARLSLATENKSGRDLKNLVDKARMRAIKRSIKNDAHRVTLEEGDFRLAGEAKHL
jgi:AAA+ superfamily predicted ATPase